MPLDEYRSANRDNWDDRVPIHLGPGGYDTKSFVDDPNYLSPVVRADRDLGGLGDVSGKSLLHLQCHIGTDTLSLARLGAKVTGIDFSEPAIEAARKLSEKSGTPGEFVVAELYDSPNVLPGRLFDVVYTGTGAICWLPDIKGWAKVVARFLKPGGTFYIIEGHPMMWSVSDTDHGDQLVLEYSYFESAGPQKFINESSYSGDAKIKHSTQYDFPHGLGETVTALIDAGLVIEFVHEHKFEHWQAFPLLEKDGKSGPWKMPEGRENDIPLMMSIRAHKPG